MEVTLPVWVGILTGSPGHVAGVAVADILPSLLAGPFAGALADRWDARKVMIVCDLLRALLMLSLLFAPASLLVPCVYAVGFLTALVGVLFNPAKNVAIRSVVGTVQVPRALALSRTTESAALVLGPAMGSAILLSFGPSAGLVFDALTFVVGAGSVATARVPYRQAVREERDTSGSPSGLVAEVRDGVRVVGRDPDLLVVFAVGGVTYLVGNVWFSVDIFFVERSLDAPKESVGWLWAASGVGGLLGGLSAVAAERVLSPKKMLLIGLSLEGGALLWYSLSTNFTLAMAAAFVSGLGGSLLSVAIGSVMMLHSPRVALGRVTALFQTTGQFSALIALIALGLLQGLLDPSRILLACSGLILVAFLCASLSFVRRSKEDQ